ncbi:MAG: ADP-ribosylation factor-like protein [Candidatus Asgardarchaeia archaeon]
MSSVSSLLKSVLRDRIKIFVTGPYNAGKTTIVHRLDPHAISIERKRPDGTTTTVGFDQGILYWLIDTNDKNKQLLLDRNEIKKLRAEDLQSYEVYEIILLGSPGQHQFAPVREILARGSRGVLFVVDSTNPGQIGFAMTMLEEVKAYLKEYIPMCILANKQDLENAMNAKRLSEILGIQDIKIFETSAITNLNLRESVLILLNKIINNEKFILESRQLLNNEGQLRIVDNARR